MLSTDRTPTRDCDQRSPGLLRHGGVVRTARARGRRRAARQPFDVRLLGPQHRAVRAERLFPVGQPRLERDPVPTRHPGPDQVGARRPRLSWCRPRAELQLHRRPQTVDGLHRRRAARQPAAAPDVQGALRAVDGSCGLRVPPVLEEASRGPDRGVDGTGHLRRIREGRNRRRESLQGEPDGNRRPPRQDARSSVDRGRSEGDRVRLLPVLQLRPVHSGTGRRAAAGEAGERLRRSPIS